MSTTATGLQSRRPHEENNRHREWNKYAVVIIWFITMQPL